MCQESAGLCSIQLVDFILYKTKTQYDFLCFCLCGCFSFLSLSKSYCCNSTLSVTMSLPRDPQCLFNHSTITGRWVACAGWRNQTSSYKWQFHWTTPSHGCLFCTINSECHLVLFSFASMVFFSWQHCSPNYPWRFCQWQVVSQPSFFFNMLQRYT